MQVRQPLSYRHLYHAGNHGDVLKHAVLSLLMGQALRRHGQGALFIDTHSGPGGTYDLASAVAQKRHEARTAVGRIYDIARVGAQNPHLTAAAKADAAGAGALSHGVALPPTFPASTMPASPAEPGAGAGALFLPLFAPASDLFDGAPRTAAFAEPGAGAPLLLAEDTPALVRTTKAALRRNALAQDVLRVAERAAGVSAGDVDAALDVVPLLTAPPSVAGHALASDAAQRAAAAAKGSVMVPLPSLSPHQAEQTVMSGVFPGASTSTSTSTSGTDAASSDALALLDVPAPTWVHSRAAADLAAFMHFHLPLPASLAPYLALIAAANSPQGLGTLAEVADPDDLPLSHMDRTTAHPWRIKQMEGRIARAEGNGDGGLRAKGMLTVSVRRQAAAVAAVGALSPALVRDALPVDSGFQHALGGAADAPGVAAASPALSLEAAEIPVYPSSPSAVTVVPVGQTAIPDDDMLAHSNSAAARRRAAASAAVSADVSKLDPVERAMLAAAEASPEGSAARRAWLEAELGDDGPSNNRERLRAASERRVVSQRERDERAEAKRSNAWRGATHFTPGSVTAVQVKQRVQDLTAAPVVEEPAKGPKGKGKDSKHAAAAKGERKAAISSKDGKDSSAARRTPSPSLSTPPSSNFDYSSFASAGKGSRRAPPAASADDAIPDTAAAAKAAAAAAPDAPAGPIRSVKRVAGNVTFLGDVHSIRPKNQAAGKAAAGQRSAMNALVRAMGREDRAERENKDEARAERGALREGRSQDKRPAEARAKSAPARADPAAAASTATATDAIPAAATAPAPPAVHIPKVIPAGGVRLSPSVRIIKRNFGGPAADIARHRGPLGAALLAFSPSRALFASASRALAAPSAAGGVKASGLWQHMIREERNKPKPSEQGRFLREMKEKEERERAEARANRDARGRGRASFEDDLRRGSRPLDAAAPTAPAPAPRAGGVSFGASVSSVAEVASAAGAATANLARAAKFHHKPAFTTPMDVLRMRGAGRDALDRNAVPGHALRDAAAAAGSGSGSGDGNIADAAAVVDAGAATAPINNGTGFQYPSPLPLRAAAAAAAVSPLSLASFPSLSYAAPGRALSRAPSSPFILHTLMRADRDRLLLTELHSTEFTNLLHNYANPTLSTVFREKAKREAREADAARAAAAEALGEDDDVQVAIASSELTPQRARGGDDDGSIPQSSKAAERGAPSFLSRDRMFGAAPELEAEEQAMRARAQQAQEGGEDDENGPRNRAKNSGTYRRAALARLLCGPSVADGLKSGVAVARKNGFHMLQRVAKLSRELNEDAADAAAPGAVLAANAFEARTRTGGTVTSGATPGLILIDPAYEGADEFASALASLRSTLTQWPNATVAVWYPILREGTVLRAELRAQEKKAKEEEERAAKAAEVAAQTAAARDRWSNKTSLGGWLDPLPLNNEPTTSASTNTPRDSGDALPMTSFIRAARAACAQTRTPNNERAFEPLLRRAFAELPRHQHRGLFLDLARRIVKSDEVQGLMRGKLSHNDVDGGGMPRALRAALKARGFNSVTSAILASQRNRQQQQHSAPRYNGGGRDGGRPSSNFKHSRGDDRGGRNGPSNGRFAPRGGNGGGRRYMSALGWDPLAKVQRSGVTSSDSLADLDTPLACVAEVYVTGREDRVTVGSGMFVVNAPEPKVLKTQLEELVPWLASALNEDGVAAVRAVRKANVLKDLGLDGDEAEPAPVGDYALQWI